MDNDGFGPIKMDLLGLKGLKGTNISGNSLMQLSDKAKGNRQTYSRS